VIPLELISGKIANFLIRSGSATEDIRDIILFGVESTFSLFVNLIFTLLIGLLFGIPLELLAFFVPFSVLRMMSGGFHAKTIWGCAVVSLLVMVAVSVIIYIDLGSVVLPISIVFILIAISTIFSFAPVMHVNHPLNDTDIMSFKKRSRIIVIVCTLICLVLLALGATRYMFFISLGIFVAAGSTLMAHLLKKGGGAQNEEN